MTGFSLQMTGASLKPQILFLTDKTAYFFGEVLPAFRCQLPLPTVICQHPLLVPVTNRIDIHPRTY